MKILQTSALAATLSLLLFAGCGKKAEEAAPEPVAEAVEESAPAPQPQRKAAPARQAEVLPGASDVRNALVQKNYQQAVNSLLVLEGTLQTDEQRNEWSALFQEVRDTLMDNAPRDRRAGEALAHLRAVRLGR